MPWVGDRRKLRSPEACYAADGREFCSVFFPLELLKLQLFLLSYIAVLWRYGKGGIFENLRFISVFWARR